MPDKAALSRYRKKISFNFFKNQLTILTSKKEAKLNKWNDLRVYATDGWHIELPRTKDLEDNNFKGRSLSEYRETYTLRMYASHCYDVLNGTTKYFEADCFNDELHWAKQFIPKLEKESLTLYDRLYPSTDVMRLHCEHQSYFLIKCRKKGVVKEIADFFKDSKRKKEFKLLSKHDLYLVKLKSNQAGADYVYVTNLPKKLRTKENIRKLYNMRWEVEVSFKNLAEIQKVEQFHSRDLNGIKQEIYASLWLMNATNILSGRSASIDDEYERVNFKLLYNWLSRNILIISNGCQELIKDFFTLRDRTKEKRKRYSRSYKRELKHSSSPYKYSNSIFVVNGVKA